MYVDYRMLSMNEHFLLANLFCTPCTVHSIVSTTGCIVSMSPVSFATPYGGARKWLCRFSHSSPRVWLGTTNVDSGILVLNVR